MYLLVLLFNVDGAAPAPTEDSNSSLITMSLQRSKSVPYFMLFRFFALLFVFVFKATVFNAGGVKYTISFYPCFVTMLTDM